MFKGKKKNPIDWQMYGMTKHEFDGSMLNPMRVQQIKGASNKADSMKDEYYCLWCFKKPKESSAT